MNGLCQDLKEWVQYPRFAFMEFLVEPSVHVKITTEFMMLWLLLLATSIDIDGWGEKSHISMPCACLGVENDRVHCIFGISKSA